MSDDPAEAAAPATQDVQSDQWTTRRLLSWITQHFTDRAIDSSRRVAEMLLSHVIGCERLRLYMEADRAASPEELTRLRELVRRASNHEPVQYLVGEAWFFGRPFEVDRSTLIPRPSTETLVDAALRWCRTKYAETETAAREDAVEAGAIDTSRKPLIETPPLRIADIGTGTGCIAITLALQLPNATFVASDVREDALSLAQRNAERHAVSDRIDFVKGDLLQPFASQTFDIICSNPPYIPEAQWAGLDANVRDHEPQSALLSGADGLDALRVLIADGPALLNPGGLLALEFGFDQHDAIIKLAEASAALTSHRTLRDHEGLWRVLLAERIRA